MIFVYSYGSYSGGGYDQRTLNAAMPNISTTLSPTGRDFVIDHYPDGVSSQRANDGQLNFVYDQIGFYSTCTFGGSSGAPLFSGNEIKCFDHYLTIQL